MSFARFISAVVLAPVLVTGCAPVAGISFLAGGNPSSNEGGAASNATGMGGATVAYDPIAPTTAPTTDAGAAAASTTSYSFLCGGALPDCSPDPSSDDCAPGGNPNLGGMVGDASAYACQLSTVSGKVKAQCGIAGSSSEGEACDASTGCKAGLACITAGEGGVCRSYCCSNVESCPAHTTFCAQAPIIRGGPIVPVCVPASQCTLLSTADTATCLGGRTCAIVRDDGTTSCVDPGNGTDGDACPCAVGYTCWKSSVCRKLCATGAGTDCDPGSQCQGGIKSYPEGIGFCIPSP